MVDKRHRRLQFLIAQQGVEGHINPGPKQVGILDQLFDIGQTVGGRCPGTEVRATDIDRIRAVINGRQTAGKIPRGRQQLNIP
jgi:hypothetical protein